MRVNFTELIGVNRVEWYFLRSVGWVFRHAGHPDIGIDAEVEETIGQRILNIHA